jgi:hypothetical protein
MQHMLHDGDENEWRRDHDWLTVAGELALI